MSRRYPTAELYEDRQRDFYRGGNRSSRSYEDLDVEIRTGESTRRGPDFLREDYGRGSAGPLVLHNRRREPTRARFEEKDDIYVRDRRDSARRGEFEREDITIREDERERRPRARSTRGGNYETDDVDVRITHREGEGRPRREVRDYDSEDLVSRRSDRHGRERDTTEIDIRHEEVDRSRGRSERDYERDDIRFRRVDGPRSRRGYEEKEEIDIKIDERETTSRGYDNEKDTLVVRTRDRSRPAPRLVAREREDIVVRRRRSSPSPPPPPRGRESTEEIIIRRTARSPTPSPERSPSPPPLPEPEPIIRPPIVQEIITHHRHIDHGVERVRSPSPPPAPIAPPSPPKEESLEIEIRRRSKSRGRATFNEEVIVDDRRRERRDTDTTEVDIKRRRSMSVPRRKHWDEQVEEDIEIDEVKSTRSRSDMWTEVTKDLVIREAVETMGYKYEESDGFFYVKEYLRYEDVLQLVEISDDIRRHRRSRFRELDIKREETDRRDRRPRGNYDERIYEREVYHDSKGRRYR